MWKSIMYTDTYPEEDVEILFVGNGSVFSGYYDGYDGAHHVWKSSREGYTFWDTEVTHWMQLPKPPAVNGWSHDFDFDSVQKDIMQSIRDNIKKWDDVNWTWYEENLKRRQEELKRLEAEHDELVNSGKARAVPTPKYAKCIFCPCANGGDGGIVNED